MSIAMPVLERPFLPAPPSSQFRRMFAAILITLALVAGTATAADAAIVPYSKGSDFWYSWFVCNQAPGVCTAGNVRYSWSWMWEINARKDSLQTMTTTACGFLPSANAKAGCSALISAFWTYIRGQLALALKYKQCLQFRFALPPLYALSSYRIARVTCVR